MNNESACFTGKSKHEKTMVKTRARCCNVENMSASVLSIVFECLDISGETIAPVAYMASQMNRDVTGCFG